MSFITKWEPSLMFFGLKKSSFLKSMLLLNFLIQWSWNILYLFNILTMLNKWIIRWFWVNVTTKAQKRITGIGYNFVCSANQKCLEQFSLGIEIKRQILQIEFILQTKKKVFFNSFFSVWKGSFMQTCHISKRIFFIFQKSCS